MTKRNKKQASGKGTVNLISEALGYDDTYSEYDMDANDEIEDDGEDVTVHGEFEQVVDDEEGSEEDIVDISDLDEPDLVGGDEEFDADGIDVDMDEAEIVSKIEALLQQLTDTLGTDESDEEAGDIDPDASDEEFDGDVEGSSDEGPAIELEDTPEDEEVEEVEEDELEESAEIVKTPKEFDAKATDADPTKPKGKATPLPKGKNDPSTAPNDNKADLEKTKKNATSTKKATLPSGDVAGAIKSIEQILKNLTNKAKSGKTVPKTTDLVKMENIKVDMSDDMSSIEGLSEAFEPELLGSVQNVLEAKLKQTMKPLMEAFMVEVQDKAKKELEERAKAHEDKVSVAVERYVEYKMEEFFEENKLVAEEGINTEINESLMDGMHKLFSEHYIEVPEGKKDVLEELAAEVESLKAKNSKLNEARITDREKMIKMRRQAVILEESEGLSDNQSEKLKELCEGLDFGSSKDFRQSVQLMKKSHFSESTSNQTTNTFETLVENTLPDVEDDEMEMFLSALPKVKR